MRLISTILAFAASCALALSLIPPPVGARLPASLVPGCGSILI